MHSWKRGRKSSEEKGAQAGQQNRRRKWEYKRERDGKTMRKSIGSREEIQR